MWSAIWEARLQIGETAVGENYLFCNSGTGCRCACYSDSKETAEGEMRVRLCGFSDCHSSVLGRGVLYILIALS